MSTSSEATSDLLGSCLSSAPNCVSISRSCWRCRSRLIACFFLPRYSSFSFSSWFCSRARSSRWSLLCRKKPPTGIATRIAISTSSFGAACQVPASFQLVRLTSSSSALKLKAMSRPLFLRRRCRRARLGGSRLVDGGALDRQVHVEFRNAALVDRRGLDLDQLRIAEPGRGLDVAHERRHARVGLRVADEVDLEPLLRDRPQV